MSGHTPGPWWFGVSGSRELGPKPFSYIGPGYYQNGAIIGADGTEVVGCDEYHVFNSPADVALIAAAPELLEALDKCRAIIKFHVKDAGASCSFSSDDAPFSALDAYKLAVAAIAKARNTGAQS